MRKHKVVTIDAEGRDRGKNFLLVEKSAWDVERWAARAMFALSRSGAEVPDEVMRAGALGILAAGLEAFKRMPFEDAEPLLDEMLTCISFVPDPSVKDPMSGMPGTRPLMRGDDFNDGDIAEVATLLKLRAEVLELHLGFSIAATASALEQAVTASSQRNMRTSPPAAVRPSRRAKRA